MTQPQNPNGDAKAIEHNEARAATPADLAAAIKAMPSPQRTLLLIDVVEDSSALGQVRAELEAVRLELEQSRRAWGLALATAATERARAEEAEEAAAVLGPQVARLTREHLRLGKELAAAIVRAARLEEETHLRKRWQFLAMELAGATRDHGDCDGCAELLRAIKNLSAAPQASTEHATGENMCVEPTCHEWAEPREAFCRRHIDPTPAEPQGGPKQAGDRVDQLLNDYRAVAAELHALIPEGPVKVLADRGHAVSVALFRELADRLEVKS